MNEGEIPLRAQHLARRDLLHIRVRTDRLFAGLMAVQFLAGILAACIISPRTWVGSTPSIHIHVYASVVLGGLIALPPMLLAIWHPGRTHTRHIIAVAQMLFSALLIHLTGGRLETHFHIFGSLAFLAFYRDWRVLIPATAVVAVDHLLRGVFWPESVFGVIAAAPWRAFEHAGWVLFEDTFLAYSCIVGAREIHAMAERQAQLEAAKKSIEAKVRERTRELEDQTTALTREIAERALLQAQLVQAQKLESIGQLAAGIAHEINTPAQYVSDNTRFLADQFHHLMRVLDEYSALLDHHEPALSWPQRIAKVRATREAVDFDFIRTEIPLAIDQSLEGLSRITTIVRAMKNFSHPGAEGKHPTDINKAIESTATVCRNRWKYIADLTLDLDPTLPDVPCIVAEFNQVILNLIVNAADAIEERHGPAGRKGHISVSTRTRPDHVEILVTDDGCGIPAHIAQRIYDPFFTTKEVGKGTGQGLAISRDIIVNKHGGEIDCRSAPGDGTTFLIRLPAAAIVARAA